MHFSKCSVFIALSLIATAHTPAQARHARKHRSIAAPIMAPIDQSPVLVQPFLLPTATDPKQANYLRRMNLEDGVFVKGTRYLTKNSVNSRDLFILDVTQSLEGGFDSVNLYDRGVASWGIMQWSAHMGSLARALWYVKHRLESTHRKKIWDKIFVASGLDANPYGLLVYGKPVTDPGTARLCFRGTSKVGKFDAKLTTHWATVLARAGRQPEIADLEVEYASKVVDGIIGRRLPNLPYHAPGRIGVTVADLTSNDPFTQALVFALWTNNPKNAFEYITSAARAARGVSKSDDPSLWAPGAFSDALLRHCRESRFGNWRQRVAMIETRAHVVRTSSPDLLSPFERDYQVSLALRKVQRSYELASRHQQQRSGPVLKPTLQDRRATFTVLTQPTSPQAPGHNGKSKPALPPRNGKWQTKDPVS